MTYWMQRDDDCAAAHVVVLLDHQETAQDLSSLQLLRPLLHAS
jgi:hypothetical protein